MTEPRDRQPEKAWRSLTLDPRLGRQDKATAPPKRGVSVSHCLHIVSSFTRMAPWLPKWSHLAPLSAKSLEYKGFLWCHTSGGRHHLRQIDKDTTLIGRQGPIGLHQFC